MGTCVIVGAGECSAVLLGKRLFLKTGDLCIAADSGFDYLAQIGVVPDLVIGDMDSLQSGEIVEMLAQSGKLSVKRLPVEKDDTDMLAAIKEGLAAGYRNFEIYGALGGRVDHAIANIQCLLYLLNRGAKGILVGEEMDIMLLRNDSMKFAAGEFAAGKRISVFAYGQDARGVTEKGLKYLLDDVVVRQEFPIGVSNQFTEKDALIQVREGILLICVETAE